MVKLRKELVLYWNLLVVVRFSNILHIQEDFCQKFLDSILDNY